MARAKSSYHISACDFFDMKTFSRMEAIIPYADAIQLAYYRLQHELNTSVPKGFNINLAALEEVSLSGGGQTMKPSDIIDLYLQRGVLVSRSTTFDGRQNPPAIQELQGGTGGAIAEYWNLINQNLDMIRQTLGLNELTDGSTPNPKLLTTVAQLAASGTNNALSDIVYSDKQITQSLAEAIVIRVQDILRTGDVMGIEKSLGKGTVNLLTISPDITKYTFGITVVDKPTAEEKAKLDELILSCSNPLFNGVNLITPKLSLAVPSPLYGIISKDSYPGALTSNLPGIDDPVTSTEEVKLVENSPLLFEVLIC